MPNQSFSKLNQEIDDFFFDKDSSSARLKNLKISGYFTEDQLAISLVKCFCEPTKDRIEQDKRFVYQQEGSLAANIIKDIQKFESAIDVQHGDLRASLNELATCQQPKSIIRLVRTIQQALQELDANDPSRKNLQTLISSFCKTKYYQSAGAGSQFSAPPPTFMNTIFNTWNMTNLFHYIDFAGEAGKLFCKMINALVKATDDNALAIIFGYLLKIGIGGPLILAKFATFSLAKLFSWENVCSLWGLLDDCKTTDVESVQVQLGELNKKSEVEQKTGVSKAQRPVRDVTASPAPVAHSVIQQPVTARDYRPATPLSARARAKPKYFTASADAPIASSAQKAGPSQIRYEVESSVSIVGSANENCLSPVAANVGNQSPKPAMLDIPLSPGKLKHSESFTPRDGSPKKHHSLTQRPSTPVSSTPTSPARSARGTAQTFTSHALVIPRLNYLSSTPAAQSFKVEPATTVIKASFNRKDSVPSINVKELKIKIDAPIHRRGASLLNAERTNKLAK